MQITIEQATHLCELVRKEIGGAGQLFKQGLQRRELGGRGVAEALAELVVLTNVSEPTTSHNSRHRLTHAQAHAHAPAAHIPNTVCTQT